MKNEYGCSDSCEHVIMDLERERDELERELHHHVRNGLALLMGIIDLSEDIPVRLSLRLRDRLETLGLIHDHAWPYKPDVPPSFECFCKSLIARLALSRGNVIQPRLSVTVGPEVGRLSYETFKDMGLILGELVQNSLDHAFPAGELGHIDIELRAPDRDSLILRVQDDGMGLPPELNRREGGGTGFKLLRAIALGLGGNLDIEGGKGTQITLRFPRTGFDGPLLSETERDPSS